jgi:paraquat-inducible protein A
LLAPLSPGHRARCYRCGSVLARGSLASLDRPLALCLAALLLLAAASAAPFLTLEYGGLVQTNFILTGATALWHDEQYFLGALVALTSVIIPGAQLALFSCVLLALRSGRRFRRRRLTPLIAFLSLWSMAGVFLIGTLVAGVKLAQLASLTPGPGLYLFAAVVLLWTLASSDLDFEALAGELDSREAA